ncbi:MAG: XdhC family protein, partial [Alphaproteobacteria bacterium]|nr:XdhC family protein [Alphaproteobacteria bacterium]
ATYGVADGDAWDVGLPCGGEIAVLIQPVGADGFAPDLFDRIEAASARGRALTLATDLATGITREQAGEGDFLNRYDPPRRLLIVGAVQIAQSLVPLAQAIGVTPVVIDPRGRFLTAERFPGVELDDRWPDEAITARFPGESTAIVTLSHDIKIDDPALEAALRAPTGYVAALGSRKSHAARLERLAAQGFDAGDLARIDGPAGLDIGAIGAAEIALSITAGMVAGFNARR